MNRRIFLNTFGKILMGLVTTFAFLKIFSLKILRNPAPLRSSKEPQILRPPGALTENKFLSKCIRCNRCQEACQTGAIRLGTPGDGAQIGTPFILAHDTACDLCLKCTTACPTEALIPIDKPEEVKMGIAIVDERTCVSHNGTGVCGACYTACPFKKRAITQGAHNAPTIHPSLCVGCGLCEEACIVKGIKAIRIFSGRQTT